MRDRRGGPTVQDMSEQPSLDPTTDTPADAPDPSTDASKPVQDWVTGDEPITGPQRSYLETLAREAGEQVPDGLTKAQASEMIDRLQATTGRGA